MYIDHFKATGPRWPHFESTTGQVVTIAREKTPKFSAELEEIYVSQDDGLPAILPLVKDASGTGVSQANLNLCKPFPAQRFFRPSYSRSRCNLTTYYV